MSLCPSPGLAPRLEEPGVCPRSHRPAVTAATAVRTVHVCDFQWRVKAQIYNEIQRPPATDSPRMKGAPLPVQNAPGETSDKQPLSPPPAKQEPGQAQAAKEVAVYLLQVSSWDKDY